MAAAGSLKFKVEYFDEKDGQIKNFVQSFPPSDLVSTVLQASAQHFSVNASEYNLCGDQGRKEALVPSTTLESNLLQNGKKLYLGKVTAAATQFPPEGSLSGAFFLFRLQIGGQKLVSVAASAPAAALAPKDPHALPPLDPIDEQLLREQCEPACRCFMSAALAFANSAHCSEERVYVFTCDEKATVHKVEDTPVFAWDAITRLRERHAELVSHNMEVERTGKGEKVETGTGMGKEFMPFHAWLGQQNSSRTQSLRRR
jgi:hypothetical protein